MLELTRTTATVRGDEEQWAPVPGYEDRYDVSTAGRVRSRVSGATLQIRPRKHPRGYLFVSLCRAGGQKQVLIHRLVLTAFAGPCPHGKEGAHLNGVRTDNRLENLIWATRSENHSHKVAHGTSNRGERNTQAKLDANAVRAIRAMYRPRSRAANYFVLAEKFGISYQHVHSIIKRKVWAHVH